MGLRTYRRKRDFAATPEPRGAAPAHGSGWSYVIQKHAASRMHHDFRLELDGVLLSWAVPKGPPSKPGQKVLAVRTEDHPLEYGGFEGVIPKGQYGGGTVMLWDRGSWQPIGDPRAGVAKGKLDFELHGERLRGHWSLVRMANKAGEKADNWLLIKRSDRGAAQTAPPGTDASVASGRSMAEIAVASERVWTAAGEATASDGRAGEGTAGRRSNGKGKGEDKREGKGKGESTDRSESKSRSRDRSSSANNSKEARKSPRKRKSTSKRKVTGEGGAATARRRKATDAEAVDASALPGARARAQPQQLQPQLATLVDAAPDGDDWLHEMKFDGYRLLAFKQGEKVRLRTRTGQDWTPRFAAVAAAVAALPVERAVLDGEVVVLRPDGISDFQALQNSLDRGDSSRLVYFAFDLPHCDGHDLGGCALRQRKQLLARLLQGASAPLRYSDHVVGHGPQFFAEACRRQLEGIVSKRAESHYRSKRSRDWLKVKCLRRQEFVVGGYTDPSGGRGHFGALLLGVHDDGALRFAGKVGTGFTARSLQELAARLRPLQQEAPPFADPPRGAEARGAHWLRPECVVEVAFTEWTHDGRLRHPSFQGVREDKDPASVRRERPAPPPAKGGSEAAHPAGAVQRAQGAGVRGGGSGAGTRSGGKGAGRRRSGSGIAAGRSAADTVAGVRISHADRVLYPESGLTKLDLARYCELVADHLLPHVVDRPLTLVRCPQGRSGKCFYQKHVSESLPAPVRSIPVPEQDGVADYVGIDDLAGLITLVQFGALELHPWGSRGDRLERPDRIVLDLDPAPDVGFASVVDAALQLRQLLDDLGLQSFARTTGGKGLHVVLPIDRRNGWDEVKQFAHDVMATLARSAPDRFVLNMQKRQRHGRIFLDYLRNGRGATAIASWSPRARQGAPVAMPLRWQQVDAGLDPAAFTVTTVPALLRQHGDPWQGFGAVRQVLTAKVRAAVHRG